jgi:hypothetical protein
MRRAGIAAVSAVILTAGAASAQESDSARARAVDAIRPGTWIRVVPRSGPATEGLFLVREGATVVWRHDSVTNRLALADIDQLWVRGRATGTGAVVGGIAGGVLGIAVGLLIGEVVCNNPDCNANTAVAVVGFGAGGAVAGGLVGAGIGSLIPRWRPRLR